MIDTENKIVLAMHKIYLAVIFFTVLIFSVHGQNNPDPDFHVYILMGQSNMAGRGEITEEFKNESLPRVFMLNKENQWVVARHPVHFDKPAIAGVGPGLSFGISIAEIHPDVRIGLVPCAVGGTSIDLWQPGSQDNVTKTHPYDDALIRIREAMKSGVIKGVIWHQGEADKDPQKASLYLSKLSRLIERIRTEVHDPELPFVAGELGRYIPNCENINHELARLPSQISNTAVASSEGLVHKGDGTHFDGPSATKLGKRFAQKMLELQGGF